MGKRKKGRSVKRNPACSGEEPESLVRAPHSFVISRGKVGRYLRALTRDFRKIMEPFTASNIIASKKNTIKDFVSVSGPLHVSHLVTITCTEVSPYLRVGRLPQGPTLTFRVHDYTLARDVISSLSDPAPHNKAFQQSPLVVLNGFLSDAPHIKLLASMFQGMFPTINITTVNLSEVRRCLLLSYNSDTKRIDLRHYGIRVTPVGLSKGVKKLVKGKVPNLAGYQDIADFLIDGGDGGSESELEYDSKSEVTLPQKLVSRGNLLASKASVRLTEIGPRITLQLVKVEGGLMDGEVMFHEYITKTKEEILAIEKRRQEERILKQKRRKEQEENVRAKMAKKEEMKKKSLEGMARAMSMKKEEDGEECNEEYREREEEEEDDDAEWYRKEVGEEPDPQLFQKHEKVGIKRKQGMHQGFNQKRFKTEAGVRGGREDEGRRSTFRPRGRGTSPSGSRGRGHSSGFRGRGHSTGPGRTGHSPGFGGRARSLGRGGKGGRGGSMGHRGKGHTSGRGGRRANGTTFRSKTNRSLGTKVVRGKRF